MKKIVSFLLVILFIYGYLRYVAVSSSTTRIEKRFTVLSPVPTAVPDKRIKALEAFLAGYNSPMAGSAKDFVEIADRYNLDYRLLPAIAGVESTMGKFTPRCAYFNAFGWTSSNSPCGFYRFKSYKESIETVAAAVSGNKAYRRWQSTGEIASLAEVYCPISMEKWTKDVNYFMDKLE